MLKISDLLSVNDLVGFKIVDNPIGTSEVDHDTVKRLVERSTFNQHRIIGPMTIVTMDFRPDRINIHVDKNDVVESVSPG